MSVVVLYSVDNRHGHLHAQAVEDSGSDKRGYRTAAAWLRENTAREDLIAVPDSRISFHAERKGLIYDAEPTTPAEYVVIIVKNENEKPGIKAEIKKF